MERHQRRKRMYQAPYLCCALLFISSFHHVLAGPVLRSSRMVREIYPEVEQEIPDSSQTQVCIVGDVVYGAGENVPSDQPCLKCTCAPLEVRCVTEICVQQPGCKAIHRPNKCCPDYQCECQHEGKTYANGERLPTAPGGECLVCYCRGGEVQCAEVGCYTRSDCEPRYVAGQCCPKYDHCPPREPLSDRVHHTTEQPPASVESDITVSWLLSGSSENTTSYETSPHPYSSENSDEGSGDFDATSSPEDISSSPTNFITNSDDTKARPSTPITFSIKEIESKVNKKTDDTVKIVTKVDKETQTDSDGRPKITIQEVIPSRTEYKITSSPQKELPPRSVSVSPINPVTFRTPGNLLSTPESVRILEDSNNELGDSESYASEKTEVYDHPPPVLRIGDQLLFIRQGQLVPEKDASTPTPVITLIGAEGLQIGLGSGELQDHEILPINSDEPGVTMKTVIPSNPNGKHLDTTETSMDSKESNVFQENTTKDSVENSSSSALENEASLETTTTASDPNYRITCVEELDEYNRTIFKLMGPDIYIPDDTSSEFIPINNSDEMQTDNSGEVTNENVDITDFKKISDSLENSTDLSNETELNKSVAIVDDKTSDGATKKGSDASLTKTVTSSLIEVNADDSEYIPEENPYYPAIPEDIMILNQEDSTTISSEPVFDNQKVLSSSVPPRNLSKSIESSEIKQEGSEEISVIPLKKIISLEVNESDKQEAENDKINTTDNPKTSETDITPGIIQEILEEKSKEINAEIVGEFLENGNNKSISRNVTAQDITEYNKNESPTKIVIPLAKERDFKIPLINDKATLPDSLLEMTATGDIVEDKTTDLPAPVTETSNSSQENISSVENTSLANDSAEEISNNLTETITQNISDASTENITNTEASKEVKTSGIISNILVEQDKSKETIEVNEDSDSSIEETTVGSNHSSLMSNEDASVEAILNDSTQINTADLVETLPGFEKTTEEVKIIRNENSEEHVIDGTTSPKLDVEIIELSTERTDGDKTLSHVPVKDFHEEIQKRDVVKKVLKDIFENPKENIRTELENVDIHSLNLQNEKDINDEQNVVKANENHDLSTRSLNPSTLKTNQQSNDLTIEENNSTQQVHKIKEIQEEQTDAGKESVADESDKQVIQKVGDDLTKLKVQESAESLDTSALGALRDFFKSQYRHYQDSTTDN